MSGPADPPSVEDSPDEDPPGEASEPPWEPVVDPVVPIRRGALIALAAVAAVVISVFTLSALFRGGHDESAASASHETTRSSSSQATLTSSPQATPPTASPTVSDALNKPDTGARTLKLSDFFQPSDTWEEGWYDVAGRRVERGIAAPVSGCSFEPEELELRLGNNFERLDFSVGQGDNSANSDVILNVEVLGNNSEIELGTVPFNEIRLFSIPVSGVNALKIRFTLDGTSFSLCSDSVIAVVADATLT